MQDSMPASASRQEVRYANLLFSGCWYAMLIMIVTYVIYIAGIKDPHTPVDRVPLYWSMPVGAYVQQAAIPPGWEWLRLASRADFLNYPAIVLFLALTIVCQISLSLYAIGNRDWILTIAALIQALLLCVAASGLLPTP